MPTPDYSQPFWTKQLERENGTKAWANRLNASSFLLLRLNAALQLLPPSSLPPMPTKGSLLGFSFGVHNQMFVFRVHDSMPGRG